MEVVLRIIVIVITVLTIVVFYTLHRNDAHISQPPGTAKRLAVFFTVNSASTSDDPYFEELRTPIFAMDAESLYQQALKTGSQLGWGILDNDRDKHDIKFIVRSPLFMFVDDVFIEVRAISKSRSSLNIQSNSRAGGADFAANSGHIQKLIKALKVEVNKNIK